MPNETAVEPVYGAQLQASEVDGVIGELAQAQHGVVSRGQLFRMGLGRRAVGHRLDRGRLLAVHRGVYAVGHRALTAEGHWMAAVLASGPGAALSHRSAAALWGIRPSDRTRHDVTVGQSRRPRPGIELHFVELPPDELTTIRGIPVTTVPRTLFDLAAVLAPRQVARAVEEAEVRRLADPLSLDTLVARHPRRHGVRTIRAILASGRIGSTLTRSELEERFLTFLAKGGVPAPEVNVNLRAGDRWLEVDALWRGPRLVVELDGYARHGTLAAYERDRARDRALHVAGWRVIRITWRQLHDHADGLKADLRRLLGPTCS